MWRRLSALRARQIENKLFTDGDACIYVCQFYCTVIDERKLWILKE